MVKKFISFFNFQGVIIFINNFHKKEIAFDYLLNLKNIECIYIYKNKPNYESCPKKIILNNFLFYIFVFLSCFKKKSKKILIFSQPIYSLPYIFFGHYLNVYFYDVHIGLNYTSKIKLFLEKFSLLFFKKIFHRDLRRWVEYKKIIKKKNRKNLLLPDFIKNNETNTSKNISKEIKCAVIGICAETNEEANLLASSASIWRENVSKGIFGPFPTLEEATKKIKEKEEGKSIVGDQKYVEGQLMKILEETNADELKIITICESMSSKKESYRLIKEIFS